MSRPKTRRARVLGPYQRSQDGRVRWYYIIVEASGSRTSCSCPVGATEEDARYEVEIVRDGVETGDAGAELVTQAVDRYVAHLKAQAHAKHSQDWASYAAKRLTDAVYKLSIDELRPHHALAFLEATADLSMATRRSYWRAFERMVRWWVKRGYLRIDVAQVAVQLLERKGEQLPWQTPAGRRTINRGKPQLRGMSEVQAYARAAMSQTDPERRVATMLPLLVGMSAGELLNLTVGQVDFVGKGIWIADDDQVEWTVKTESRRRSLPLPEDLADDLRELCEGRAPEEPVFRQSGRGGGRAGAPRTRTWLRDRVVAVCQLAKVRKVCPHGLRGTWSSMLVAEKQRSLADVGSVLGHADAGKTAGRHYVGAAERRRELKVVTGGREE